MLATTARLLSARQLARQSESPTIAEEHRALPLRASLASLRARGSTRVLAYLLAMQLAAHVAAPFFTPYMLRTLHMDYATFAWLTSLSVLAKAFAFPIWRRVFARIRPDRALAVSGGRLWAGTAGNGVWSTDLP